MTTLINRNKQKVQYLMLMLATLGILFVVACGDNETEQQTNQIAQQATINSQSALAGQISVDGSSTVYPISEAMAAEFGIQNPDIRINVGISGTGGGFKRFCVGETDINNASRPILNAEIKTCKENGIDFVEVQVAYDGLTVAVGLDNDWVDNLTVTELNHIFRQNDFATTWSDVRNGFPDVEIKIFAPGSDSGTFDYFTEVVNGESGNHRSNSTTFSEDDNVLVTGVSSTRGGIGYFGFPYYAENSDLLRAVPIVNDTGEPVLPSRKSINNGSYNPLSRPLFIYVSTISLERTEVATFVEYYITDGVYLIDTVGYVQLPQETYADALEQLQRSNSNAPHAE